MKKGKFKKQKKYLSILLIPHSSEHVKKYNISFFYPKVFAVFGLLLASLILGSAFIVHTTVENRRLEANNLKLLQLHAEKESTLKDKTGEIQALNDKQYTLQKQVDLLTRKFNEMTDNYVTNRSSRSSSLGSRGQANDRQFIDDMTQLKAIMDDLKANGSINKEALNLSPEIEVKLNQYIDSIPTLYPTKGKISSYYGGRKDPFESSEKFHRGIDIAASHGEKILASASGIVTLSESYGGYGYAIMIDHGHGISTLYGHCSALLVKEGEKVKKGQVIANVGSTGRSTGPHLHFEVRVDGSQVDPLRYIKEQ